MISQELIRGSTGARCRHASLEGDGGADAGDADARVVQVDVALDPADAKKVMRLAGLKVIARFQANS